MLWQWARLDDLPVDFLVVPCNNHVSCHAQRNILNFFLTYLPPYVCSHEERCRSYRYVGTKLGKAKTPRTFCRVGHLQNPTTILKCHLVGLCLAVVLQDLEQSYRCCHAGDFYRNFTKQSVELIEISKKKIY